MVQPSGKLKWGDGTEINSVQRRGCYQDAGDVGMLNSRQHGQECVLQPSDGIPGGKKRFVDERAWPQKLWSVLTLPLQLPTPLLPPLTCGSHHLLGCLSSLRLLPESLGIRPPLALFITHPCSLQPCSLGQTTLSGCQMGAPRTFPAA